MEIIPFELQAGDLNNTYDRILNCRKVKPPYEKDGYYSDKFFLDKRFDLKNIFDDSSKKFLDRVTIKWNNFYLYREWDKHYVGHFDGTTFTTVTSWFDVDDNSPLRFAVGRWMYWPTTWSVYSIKDTGQDDVVSWIWWDKDFDFIPGYSWGYVKLKPQWWTGPFQAWDFIMFTWDNTDNNGSVLWGCVNRVELVEWDYIYIIGTNARWTLPKQKDKFVLFKSKTNAWQWNPYGDMWATLLIGHTTGVSLIILDWSNAAYVKQVMTTDSPVIDIVNFDWNIFVLTENHMYFSRSNFASNTQFYPLDSYYIDGWYKMFPIGKALLVFARTNKLFSAANSTQVNVWYVWYDVNYNWDLFSKYSFVFDDQTIYILQDDRKLFKVDITQNNTTTFDLVLTDALTGVKWLFHNLDGWEVFISSWQSQLNFLYIKDWKTVNYKYDKVYNDFMEDVYEEEIYFFDDEVLTNGWIFIEEWYGDYKQEVNFTLDTNMYLYLPYIVRTFFWLVDNPFDINLEIEFEIWWVLDRIDKRLYQFDFDNRLSTTLTGDDLIEWYEPVDDEPKDKQKYNWNLVSIQSNVMKTWRFINFRYTSDKRFCIWPSYIVSDKTKTYINEPLHTN